MEITITAIMSIITIATIITITTITTWVVEISVWAGVAEDFLTPTFVK